MTPRAALFFFSLSGCLVMSSAVAWANPIATEILRVRQVYGTHHVQITYGVDTSFGPAGALNTPSELTRDGEVLNVAWTRADTAINANTGSGLVGIDATQTCDCEVPAGAHTYVVNVVGPTGSAIELQGVLTVEEEHYLKADAGAAPASDLSPWDIPEPDEIQGLDCKTVCGQAQKDSGAVTPQDAGPAVQKDAAAAADSAPVTPPAKAEEDDGGCAVAGADSSAAGLVLALLVLGLGLIRSRRRA